MKIDIYDTGITVKCRQRGWDHASRTAVSFKGIPPDGYKLVRSDIRPRTKSGAACNLTLEFRYIDTRVEPFTLDEAFQHFRDLEPVKSEEKSGELFEK